MMPTLSHSQMVGDYFSSVDMCGPSAHNASSCDRLPRTWIIWSQSSLSGAVIFLTCVSTQTCCGRYVWKLHPIFHLIVTFSLRQWKSKFHNFTAQLHLMGCSWLKLQLSIHCSEAMRWSILVPVLVLRRRIPCLLNFKIKIWVWRCDFQYLHRIET